ncbi:MAG TPA: SIMPL domain-containing protein [Limnochordia bacterium]|nr:SIMPL domain-containing protein [Limnochordia bacterium]
MRTRWMITLQILVVGLGLGAGGSAAASVADVDGAPLQTPPPDLTQLTPWTLSVIGRAALRPNELGSNLNFSVEATATTAAAAIDKARAQLDAIQQALVAGGVDAETLRLTDLNANQSGPIELQDDGSEQRTYHAYGNLVVTGVSDARLEEVIQLGLKAGASGFSTANTGDNRILWSALPDASRHRLLDRAYADAGSQAAVLADAMGADLGRAVAAEVLPMQALFPPQTSPIEVRVVYALTPDDLGATSSGEQTPADEAATNAGSSADVQP